MYAIRSYYAPGVTMGEIYKSVTPFICIKLAVLILCMLVPELVLWLPNKLMG